MARLLVLLAAMLGAHMHNAAAAMCGWSDSDGNKWDLSALTKTTGNWEGNDASYNYAINPCSVVNDRAGCTPGGSDVCQFYDTSFVASLGKFDANTPWSHLPGKPASAGLQYTMTNGDECFIAGRKQVRTVNVQFECANQQAAAFTVTEDITTCSFYINLKTPLACIATDRTPCEWKDEHSGLRWDVRGLRKTTGGDYFTFVSPNNYTLNLCGPTIQPSGGCADGRWAVCQMSYRGDFLAGLATFDRAEPGHWSLLTPDPSTGAQLTFKNGDYCIIGGLQVARTTTIEFHCNPTGARRFIVMPDPTTCSYKIRMDVAEGCPHRF